MATHLLQQQPRSPRGCQIPPGTNPELDPISPPPSLVGVRAVRPGAGVGKGPSLSPSWVGTEGSSGASKGFALIFWQRELSPCLWAWGITCSPAICSCPGFDRVVGKQIRSQHTFEGLLFIHKTNPNTYKKKMGKKPPTQEYAQSIINKRIAQIEQRVRRREQPGPALRRCTSPSEPFLTLAPRPRKHEDHFAGVPLEIRIS